MNRLKAISNHIYKEHVNLSKSINRTRTLQGILEKTEFLNDLIKEYKLILYQNKYWLSGDDKLNDEVELYQAIKIKYTECIQILEKTPLTTSSKHSLKAVTNSIIFCKRLSGSIKSWEHPPATSITSETETNEKQSNKMPDQPFDIKTATALVQ